MSDLFTTTEQGYAKNLVDDMSSIIDTSGSALVSKETSEQFMGLESLDAETKVVLQDTFSGIETALAASALGINLKDSGFNQEQIEIGLRAGAMTVAAAGDGDNYLVAACAPTSSEGAILLNHDSALPTSDTYGTESFAEAHTVKYLAQSVVINTASAIQGDFEETFFRTKVIPAGKNGFEMSISIPVVFKAPTRNSNGDKINFDKVSIIKAVIDSTVLESSSTFVIPNVANASDKLVAANLVNVDIRDVDGVDVSTRPIKMGVTLDILGASQHAGMVGQMNDEDYLDNTLALSKLLTAVTLDVAGVPIAFQVETDTISQSGAGLINTPTGKSHDMFASFPAQIIINQDTKEIGTGGATTAAFQAALKTLVGTLATTSDKFTIVLEANVNVNINTETGKTSGNASVVEVISVTAGTDNVPVGTSVISLTDNAIEVIGYDVSARRANTNFRTRGLIIDTGSATKYRWQVRLGAPFVAKGVRKAGSMSSAVVESLIQAHKIRTNNQAVKTLINAKDVLEAGNGIPELSPMIGAKFVTPTFIKVNGGIDLTNSSVVTEKSQEALDDQRGALIATIDNMINVMIRDSGYMAALQYVKGNRNQYEAIIVTDEHIASYLMHSGDERTFGATRKFKVTTSLDSRITGKIFISLRTTGNNEPDALTSGMHLFSPVLVHDIDTAHGGSHIKETHTVPRNSHYWLLPVMGYAEVIGLDVPYVG